MLLWAAHWKFAVLALLEQDQSTMNGVSGYFLVPGNTAKCPGLIDEVWQDRHGNSYSDIVLAECPTKGNINMIMIYDCMIHD